MKPTPTTFIVALAAVAVLAASGCSGSDDSSSDTTAPTVASVPDTGPTTSFNVPQVTAATVPTTDPNDTTTIAPTTSQPPVAGSVEEAVGAAAVAARAAYIYAVFNVGAPDALDPLRATHAAGGESLQIGLDNYQMLVDNGWLVRPNPEIEDLATVEGDFVVIDDITAELTLCTVGAATVYAPGGNADGSDLVINDEIGADRSRVTMVLQDGVWKLRNGKQLGKWIGETTCPAE
jgi:hypothetical protein